MTYYWLRRAGAPLLALALLGAACGDDESEDAATTTEAPSDTSGEEAGGLEEFCAVAEEISQQEDFPTAEQVEQYVAAAPDEIKDEAETIAPVFAENEGDPVALFAAFAEDDVEDAMGVTDAFEAENCGLDKEPSEGELEPDESANRVDVTAIDYSFEFAEPVEAGNTSFVVTNDGDEAHFLLVIQVAEGHTFQEALEFEGDPEEAGILTDFELETRLVAPGGDDQEVVTGELEPGDYAMVCFVPGADGTPHAFNGMAVPFTVA